MEFIFLNYLADLGHWIYPLLFLGIILEGDAVILVATFAAWQGLIPMFGLLPFAFLSSLVADNLWYLLGRYEFALTKPLIFVAEKVTNPFLKRLENSPLGFIILSKFTYGINHLTLMRSGMMKMAYRQYLRIILLADLIWVVVMGSLGYFLGASFQALKHYLRYGEIGLLIVLLLVVFSEKLVRYFVKKNEEA